jgi:hypothetical protein
VEEIKKSEDLSKRHGLKVDSLSKPNAPSSLGGGFMSSGGNGLVSGRG